MKLNFRHAKIAGLLWTQALIVAAVIFAQQQGYFAFILPEDDMFTYTALTLLLVLACWFFIPVAFARAKLIDKERQALATLKNHLQGNGKLTDKVRGLFAGTVFSTAEKKTALSDYILALAETKRSNPDGSVNQGDFSALMHSKLSRACASINNGGNMLAKLGIIGTYVGIAVGLKIDFSVLADQDVSVAITMFGQVISGIAVAVLTSLLGMIANVLLTNVHNSLTAGVDELVDTTEELSLTYIMPVINDNKLYAKATNSDNA